MGDAPQIPDPELKAQELQRAFDVFNQVSQELTLAYEALQGRVESLTAGLAVANWTAWGRVRWAHFQMFRTACSMVRMLPQMRPPTTQPI